MRRHHQHPPVIDLTKGTYSHHKMGVRLAAMDMKLLRIFRLEVLQKQIL